MFGTNPENPWVRGYQYWTPSRGTTSIASYWSKRGEKKPYPAKNRRGRPPAPRGLTRRSARRLAAHQRGKASGAVRHAMAVARKREYAKTKRKPSAYNLFVKSFAKSHPGMKGPALIVAASKAYRGGTVPAAVSKKTRGGKMSRRRAANPRTRRFFAPRRRFNARRRKNPTPFRYTMAPVSANPTPFRYTMAPVSANPAPTPFRYTMSANPRRRGRRKNVWYGQPRRHAKAARLGWARARRANPYVTTARFFENPNALANPTMTAKAFVGEFTKPEWLKNELLPLAGGFVGTKVLTGYLIPKFFAPKEGATEATTKRWETFKKYKWGLEAVMAIGGGLAIGFGLKNTPAAVRFTTGGLIAALVTLLEGQETYQRYAGAISGISGIGQTVTSAITDELSKAIEAEVAQSRAGVSGMGQSYAEEFVRGGGQGAYASEEDMAGTFGAYASEEDMDTPSGQGGGISLDAFLAEPAAGI